MALPLKLDDHAVFESFWSAGNDAVVAFLVALARDRTGPGCWIWGAAATGKTHLLQALCERSGDAAVYLPFGSIEGAGAEILDGLARRPFVCLDDIDRCAGDVDFEFALFELYNQVTDNQGVLIAAASTAQRESKFELPDLRSRFALLPAFRLRQLAESDRIKALQLRAGHRGLDLPEETAAFLLSRSKRDMASLYELLDKLDTEALRAKRRLTIPFVRDVLSDFR